MAWPGVGQAQLLSDVFARAIEQFSPQSVAVPGCAGGNGFERIPPSVSRVVGVDQKMGSGLSSSHSAMPRQNMTMKDLTLEVHMVAASALNLAAADDALRIGPSCTPKYRLAIRP